LALSLRSQDRLADGLFGTRLQQTYSDRLKDKGLQLLRSDRRVWTLGVVVRQSRRRIARIETTIAFAKDTVHPAAAVLALDHSAEEVSLRSTVWSQPSALFKGSPEGAWHL
jgi:hypothetical protein